LHFTSADWALIAFYLMLMIGIGVYLARFQKSTVTYFLGANKIPWWVSGLSLWMSGFGAAAFVMDGSLGYQWGFIALLIAWRPVLGHFIGGLVFSIRWRRLNMETPFIFLEKRFSPVVRQLFVWARIPMRFLDDGLKIYGLAILISGAFGIPFWQGVLSSGIVITIYCTMGGLWAVQVTDVVQAIFVVAGMAILVPLSYIKTGGWQGFISSLPTPDYSTSDIWTVPYLIGTVLLYIICGNGEGNIAQRYTCVNDERSSRKVGYLAAICTFIFTPLFMFPAIAAHGIIPNLDPGEFDMAFIKVCTAVLPAGVIGLVMVAFMASTMSSSSSNLNFLSGVLTRDVYQRLFRKNSTEKELVIAGKVFTIIIGVIGTIMAMIIPQFGGAFRYMQLILGISVPPMMLPILLALIYRRATSGGMAASLIVGLVVSILGSKPVFSIIGIEEYWQWGTWTIINIAATICAFFIGSSILKASDKEKEISEPLKVCLNTEVSALKAKEIKGSTPDMKLILGVNTFIIGILVFFISFTVESAYARILEMVVSLLLIVFGGILLIFWRKEHGKQTNIYGT
jgi:SSS family transporter